MTEIIYTDEFGEWIASLVKEERKSVGVVVGLLRENGIQLGHPFSSAIKGCRHAFRELRPKQGKSPLRVVYAFDPRRDAVLIIGGDKSGDPRFYERIIKKAERIWDEYLDEQAAGKHDKGGGR